MAGRTRLATSSPPTGPTTTALPGAILPCAILPSAILPVPGGILPLPVVAAVLLRGA